MQTPARAGHPSCESEAAAVARQNQPDAAGEWEAIGLNTAE